MQGQRTYIFDFDSTLVQSESLDELAKIALRDNPKQEKIIASLEAITRQGMTGELPFNRSLDQRLRLFQANRRHVQQLIEQLTEQISPSALSNNSWFEGNTDNIYVISGGFDDYIIPVAEKIGIKPENIFANRFIYDGKENIIGYDKSRNLCRPQGKVHQIKLLNLPRPIIMIGDGYTDYEVKKHGEADEFWAFVENASRPKIIQLADRTLQSYSDIVSA